MPILIDGYNLLFAAGLARPPGWQDHPTSKSRHSGGASSELEAGRNALVRLLARRLNSVERQSTTIVFDAKNGRAGGDAEYEYRGIRIVFAHEHHEADDLIEILIRRCSQPHNLLVISSDTRIQTAATRRRAETCESDAWLMHLEHERSDVSAGKTSTAPSTKPAANAASRKHATPDHEDVAHWLAEFDLNLPDRSHGTPLRKPERSSRPQRDLGNPFPPGYGEDLELGDDIV